jgi:hypothetical protein
MSRREREGEHAIGIYALCPVVWPGIVATLVTHLSPHVRVDKGEMSGEKEPTKCEHLEAVSHDRLTDVWIRR